MNAEGTSLITMHVNERFYKERDLNMARQPSEVIRALGYPSQRSAIELMNSGAITNCPVTAQVFYVRTKYIDPISHHYAR